MRNCCLFLPLYREIHICIFIKMQNRIQTQIPDLLFDLGTRVFDLLDTAFSAIEDVRYLGALCHHMFPVNELQLFAPWVDEGAPPGADGNVTTVVDSEPERFALARLPRLRHDHVKRLLDDHQVRRMEKLKDVRADDVLGKVAGVGDRALIEPAEFSLRRVLRYKLALAAVQLDRSLLEGLCVGASDGDGRDEHVNDLMAKR